MTIGLHRTDGRICIRPSHYMAMALPEITHLTADPRLHDDGDGEECVLHPLLAAPKRYRTIVVDPPWAYYLRRHDTTQRGRCKYGDMTVDQIAAVPVGEWGDTDAHLYLWTTNNHIEHAHPLVRGWGFEPKTVLTWVKNVFGVGGYYRNSTEHVLFAVRGKLATNRKDVATHFNAPRGKHSEKPAAFYDMVESMSPGPYLDVFARKHRFGWDVYGNEVYSDIPLVQP